MSYVPWEPRAVQWMRRAIELEKQSLEEDRRDSVAPRVGAVLTIDDEVVAESFRGKTGPGDHAEYGLFYPDFDVERFVGATVYTTLEPCSKRSKGKTPCAIRLVDQRISRVLIGVYDPNPWIYRDGWRILSKAGVHVGGFPKQLRDGIEKDNTEFMEQYQRSVKRSGAATINIDGDANYIFTFNGIEFFTHWTPHSPSSVHGYGEVAVARNAANFEEVDDPGMYRFTGPATGIVFRRGEIIVFRNDAGYCLVQLDEIIQEPTLHIKVHYEIEDRTN